MRVPAEARAALQRAGCGPMAHRAHRRATPAIASGTLGSGARRSGPWPTEAPELEAEP